MKEKPSPRVPFRLGDRVRITDDYWNEDLRGKVGIVADPGEYVRRHVAIWKAREHYWRTEQGDEAVRVYWIEFKHEIAGDVAAAEVDENALIRVLPV